MSAPTTNSEKQKRRHLPALVAAIGAIVIAGIVILSLFGGTVETEESEAVPPATVGEE